MAASYATADKTYYFHPRCFDQLCDASGKMDGSRIEQALRQFDRQGFEPTVEFNGVTRGIQEYIAAFEPPEEKKVAYLEIIEMFLAHYKQPMSRKAIAYETGVPYTTVCWRVWDHLEGTKDPRFYIDKQRGPRGIELVGLIKVE